MQQLGELAQKTFAITPEMGKALGDAKRSMQQALDGLEKRNGRMASMMQGNAMGSLNEAANLMKGSMEVYDARRRTRRGDDVVDAAATADVWAANGVK